jgi:HEPN domain-containing protein
MKRATREWIGKAEDDYRVAELIAGSKKRFYDQTCFLCQQSAEKYLKALLEELGISIQKTHELEKLIDKLIPVYPSLRPLRRGLKFLTNFSVDIRYPGDNATKRQATAALRWAGKVHKACRKLVKL